MWKVAMLPQSCLQSRAIRQGFSAPIRRVTLRKTRHGSPGAGTHPDHQPIAIIGSGSRGYGLGRFPVTLYKAQWEKLLGEVDNIRKFLDENADKLAVKE